MTRHDLELDGDYRPYHDLSDEYSQMDELMEKLKEQMKNIDTDDVDELGELSDTADSLHCVLEEIIGWKLEMEEYHGI